MEETTWYKEGYTVGVNDSKMKNPYPANTGEWQEWFRGYAAGYRAFVQWVNMMCG